MLRAASTVGPSPVASGTSNALRQLGTVLGIAVLASIFSAYGSYATPAQFVAGMTPAMKVGGTILAAGAALILLATGRTPVPDADTPLAEAEQLEPIAA